jgi:hypothetical protein
MYSNNVPQMVPSPNSRASIALPTSVAQFRPQSALPLQATLPPKHRIQAAPRQKPGFMGARATSASPLNASASATKPRKPPILMQKRKKAEMVPTTPYLQWSSHTRRQRTSVHANRRQHFRAAIMAVPGARASQPRQML